MNRFASLLIFFTFFQFIALSQESKVDSLKNKLNTAVDGEKLSALIDLSYLYLDSTNSYETTIGYLDSASKLADDLRNDSAKIVLQNLYGLADYYTANYEEATSHFFKGLELEENHKDPKLRSKLLNNLGLIYDEMEDFDKAISFYQQSRKLDSIVGNESGILLSYINLAISYQNKKMLDTAFYLNEKALALAEKLKDSLSIVNVTNNQGTIEYDRKSYDSSLGYYNEALRLYQSLHNKDGVATTYNNIGLIYLDKKEYPLALSNFLASLKIANEQNLYDLSGDIYSNLSIYYEEVQDYKNAFLYYHKYNEVYDSLIGEKKNLMIRKLESQYNIEKKQREILELQQQNQQQKEELNSREIQQFYMYLIILLVIVSLIVVFYLLRKERKLSLELKDKTVELKKLNSAKDKFFSIIAHDLKNPFNALISYTSLLREDFERFTRDELVQIIADLNNATEQGFKLLENLLHWTRSQTNRIKVFKTRFNLLEVCEEVDDLAKSNLLEKAQTMELAVDCNIEVFADKDMLSTVIRNLIFNAIKFSHRGASIKIEAERLDGLVKISVIDHGIGIAEKDLVRIFQYDENTTTFGTDGEAGSGLGLVICREFVGKNGGEIWVNSEPGVGSTFSFTIPIFDSTSKGE